MPRNGLSISEVTAFAERIKAALMSAEADRRTVEALKTLIRSGPQASRTRGRVGRANDGRVLDHVRKARSGVQVGQLMKILKMNRKTLARSLARLRADGSIKMVGSRRLARYHAI